MNKLKVARFEFSLFCINTYVVWDPVAKECAVIDPGMINPEEQKAIRDFIGRESLNVEHLLNTHLHIDHSIGNRWVETTFGVTTEASGEDTFLGKHIAEQARMFGLPFKVDDIVSIRKLQEGDIVRVGGGELHVLHVPGHSPGSLVFYDREDGFLIAGDVLFQGSIGRTDLAGGDHGTLLAGIREKLFTLPPSTIVYPGHGPETTIGREITHNPFF